VARVQQAADDIRVRFDDAITERLIPGAGGGLRAAVAETGLIHRVRAHGDGIVDEAVRVRSTYDDLLRAISYAFDERRVREADAPQKASALLGIAIALVGAVTVLDATINMKPGPGESSTTILDLPPVHDDLVQWAGFGTSVVLGVVLLVSAASAVAWLLRLGTLGSRAFRRLYDGSARSRWYGIWHLLKDYSTERLESVRRYEKTNDDTWRELDKQLARDFADLWDRYRLPQLTCLFRYITPTDSALCTDSTGPPVTMVSLGELTWSLAVAGLDADDVRRVDDWLRAQRIRDAKTALRHIEKLGVEVGMSAGAIARLRELTRPGRSQDQATVAGTVARPSG
jgi:hypothetical protein